MSFSLGSLMAWSKEGAKIVPGGKEEEEVDVFGGGSECGIGGLDEDEVGSGLRRACTRARKEAPSKVNSAPRRACAVLGSGMAESWARVRW